MMQLNTLSVALFNQIVQVGLTHVAYAANFLHCYNMSVEQINHCLIALQSIDKEVFNGIMTLLI